MLGFLFSSALPAQPIRYDYRQFLNTLNWDILSSQSFQPSKKSRFEYLFSSQSVLQNLDQKQIRDEITFNSFGQYEIEDSLIVYGKIKTLSVFLDQENVSRTLDWLISAGVSVPYEQSKNSFGIGSWMTEQSNISENGLLYEFNHESSLPTSELLDTKLSADFLEGRTSSRYLGKSNIRISVQEQERHFGLTYEHNQLKRDFISNVTASGLFYLNYRYENNDRLSADFSYSLTENISAKYHLDLSGRSVRRFADSPNLTAPNTEVNIARSSHVTGISWHSGSWIAAVQTELQFQTENYRVTETTGLTGNNFDIQQNKFSRRNNESYSITLQPDLSYSGNGFDSKTAFFIQKSSYENPNNNRLDDRDLGTIGAQQTLTFLQSEEKKLSYSIEYQQLHQVFIHRDNSGDNYRNHFLKLSQDWITPISHFVRNRMAASISSQLRLYDFDSRFINKKSFSFRIFQLEDSLKITSGNILHLVTVRSSENIQGKFFADSFSEQPLRSFSLYALEYGIRLIDSHFQISARFINQDQFIFQQSQWKIMQKIQQAGPVITYDSTGENHELSADLWLQFQALNHSQAEFLPSVRFSYQYSF